MSYYDGSKSWLEFEITEMASGGVIWKKKIPERRGTEVPGFDHGRAELDLVQWAADSSEVRIAYRSGAEAAGGPWMEVAEWFVVKINAEGEVTGTERVPGSTFSAFTAAPAGNAAGVVTEAAAEVIDGAETPVTPP